MKEKVLVTGGAGYIGSILVEKLLKKKFEVTVLDNFTYTNLSLSHLFHYKNLKLINLDIRDKYLYKKYLKESDIISVHTNYLPENKYIIDAQFINKVEKPFVLINTARGFNVNTQDVVAGLKSGKILGACLDVLEYESTSFESVSKLQNCSELEYLKQSSNVILSPHIAGWSHESYFKLSNVLFVKV